MGTADRPETPPLCEECWQAPSVGMCARCGHYVCATCAEDHTLAPKKPTSSTRRRLLRSLTTYLVLGTLSLAIACGPTSQVRIERHLQCDTTGRDCQTVEIAKEEPTATGWAMFALLLLAVASSGR